MRHRTLLPLLFLLALPIPAAGQFTPTKEPYRDGIRATADLPVSQHKRNVGGSDGYGLCVYTSAWHAAMWQSVSELYGFREWMTRRPGGSYPQKFDQTLAAYCKEKGIAVPGYVQHTGGDDDFLRLALKTGRMVCITYCGMDGLYRDRAGNDVVVAHMVNLVYLDDERACILDNNFPGQFLWMTAKQLLCRWRGIQENGRPYLVSDGVRRVPVGGGWAIALLAAPPAPYPDAPGVSYGATPNPCVCGDNCKCDASECPAKCPVVSPVMVGQCPGGTCPLPRPGTVQIRPTVPSLPNPFGPVYPSPGRVIVPQPMPSWQTTPTPIGLPPTDRHYWGLFPNGMWGWRLRDDVLAPPVEMLPPAIQVIPIQAAAPEATEYPQGGVDCSRLSGERRYSIAGVPATKAEVEAALLADDSDHWHLSVVGDPAFFARVKADLPSAARSKVHIQGYAPDAWQTTQFRLPAGITLRKPAVGRVGADLGTIPPGDYSTAKLVELLSVQGGPTAAPAPAPTPRPKEPVVEPRPAPTPEVPSAPNDQARPDHSGLLALVAALALLIVTVLRR